MDILNICTPESLKNELGSIEINKLYEAFIEGLHLLFEYKML